MTQLSWLESLVSTLNIHIILTKVLPGKLRKVPAIITAALIFGCCMSLSVIMDNIVQSIATVVLTSLIVVSPLVNVQNIKKRQILYTALFYIGISSTISVALFWAINSFGLGKSAIIVVDVVVNCVLLFLGLLVFRKSTFLSITHYIGMITSRMKIWPLLTVLFCDFSAIYLSKFFETFPSTPQTILMECVFAVAIIMVGILLPRIINDGIEKAHYRKKSMLMDRQMEIQKAYYDEMTRKTSKLREFQHDYNNHKIAIMGFLAREDEAGLKCYLEELSGSILSGERFIETGNPIADALLYDKSKVALEHNIIIKFKGIIPNNIIANTDVCAIFSNALDNAIEACLKFPDEVDKQINISAKFSKGLFILNIDNPTLENVQIQNNYVHSTKNEKEQHGLGIASIKRATDNYSGKLELSCVNNTFCLKIVLDLNDYEDVVSSKGKTKSAISNSVENA